MAQEEFNADDLARFKNLLFCAWIGLIYGICGSVVTDLRWPSIGLIILLAGGSSYFGVGRRWLQRAAPLVLFVTMIGLAGLFPTRDDLRSLTTNATAWTCGSSG
jgi:hypothetical protein